MLEVVVAAGLLVLAGLLVTIRARKSRQSSTRAEAQRAPLLPPKLAAASLGAQEPDNAHDGVTRIDPARTQRRDKLVILAIATEWDSAHGGLSTFNRELCCALAEDGHIVYCGVPALKPGEVERATRAQVRLVAPASIPGSEGEAALNRPVEGISDSVDIVIGHGRKTGGAALAQLRYLKPRPRYVHFVHMDPKAIEWHKNDGQDDRDATRLAEERVQLELTIGREAALIAAVGPELQNSFAMYFRPFKRDVHEFLPGLFDSDWDATPATGQMCLVFGRAEDTVLKGVSVAAAAMGKVCAMDELRRARLFVKGAPRGTGDDLHAQLMKHAGRKLRLTVEEFTADRQVVLNSIRSASLVLMPSREEGFGLTGLEAISEAVPVLLSRTSGLAQAIEKRLPKLAEAHVFDVEDELDVIADRIRAVLVDPDAAFDRVKQLKEAMRTDFNWKRSTRALIEALGSSTPPPPSSNGGQPPIDDPGDAVAKSFSAISAPLVSWRQTLHATNEWIKRPELDRVLEFAHGETKCPLVLLGEPGSGTPLTRNVQLDRRGSVCPCNQG
jgi:glycosyltransferase involved in cell wall biosynthesis